MEETKETLNLDIYPASKGKRILAFLGDFFINFCLAVFLFSIVVFNISSAITNYPSKLNKTLTLINQRMDILYENNLLKYEEDKKYSFSDNLTTTFDSFLSFYVINEGDDVLKHYYIDIKNEDYSYLINIYNEFDTKFFAFENNTITLKDEYIEFFKPHFDPNDSLSVEGLMHYSDFKNNVFTKIYNEILLDIEKNDLKYNDYSYIKISNELDELKKDTIRFNTINIYISFAISSLIIYVLFPLLFKDRGTIMMKALKLKRININNNDFIKRPNYLVVAINNILMNFTMIFFVGFVYIGLEESFNYLSLLFLSMVSFIYVLINFGFLSFNKLNRSINELATNSIIITNDDLEEIYKAKGYGK